MKTLENDKSVPAFLGKLWKMVNDPKTDNLICWGKAGTTFIIRNEMEFWYKLLPLYYKHNNMSSFIRQLNMYGFHKTSVLNAGSVTNDKVEFEFIHPYFQRGKPDLLTNIKRKVTNATKFVGTPEKKIAEIANQDQLSKILADVKYLHNRQAQVDIVINNLKQENSVLWRELALLRQKHQKQLQIVNKLIQFLMTVVQPSTRRGGLGVKRRYPLMLNENPEKKQKTASDGPTIHELDSADVLPENFLEDAEVQDIAQVESPKDNNQQTQINEKEGNLDPGIILDNTSDLQIKNENLEELLGDTDLNEEMTIQMGLSDNFNFPNEDEVLIDSNAYKDVFLNPASEDALLTNITDGTYNKDVLNDVVSSKEPTASTSNSANMTLAKCYPNLSVPPLSSIEDIRNHQDTTQNELEQLKEFLSGYNSIDSKYLLNLFAESPTYGLTTNQNRDDSADVDLLTGSGSELTAYEPGIIDLNELFQDSTDGGEFVKPEYVLSSPISEDQGNPIEFEDLESIFTVKE